MTPPPDESDQLPEEAPAGQAEDEGGDRRESAHRSEAERPGSQGQSRGAERDDETAQTGNPDNAG